MKQALSLSHMLHVIYQMEVIIPQIIHYQEKYEKIVSFIILMHMISIFCYLVDSTLVINGL